MNLAEKVVCHLIKEIFTSLSKGSYFDLFLGVKVRKKLEIIWSGVNTISYQRWSMVVYSLIMPPVVA